MAEYQSIEDKKLDELHLETLEWKSSIQFIIGEISFIKQLVNSYSFEPHTRNLFERVQEFKEELKKIETSIEKMRLRMVKHENQLGGILEQDRISFDHEYYKKHRLLERRFKLFYQEYRELKSNIFTYLSSVLKGNKK